MSWTDNITAYIGAETKLFWTQVKGLHLGPDAIDRFQFAIIYLGHPAENEGFGSVVIYAIVDNSFSLRLQHGP